MNILFLESFFGGSHRDVAKGFARHSAHKVTILSLPPRFWKWRMRGAALHFAEQVTDISAYDLVFATDMLDLTDFKALAGPACPPVVLYFHENQLSYPLAPGEKRDFHLGFTNIVSARAADLVLFNSGFHRDDFFRAAESLIRKMPDFRPFRILDEIREKTRILYPGCDLPDLDGEGKAGQALVGHSKGDPPLIIWNHRWEYDKDPDAFFRSLARVRDRGADFRLAMMGEQYDTWPESFDRAKKAFSDRISVWGYRESVEEYRSWLDRGDCVVSTAIQENFGISVVEAMARGCFPLLPGRLSYPELIPQALHDQVIYRSEADLADKLMAFLSDPETCAPAVNNLSAHVRQFAWDLCIDDWDNLMASAAKGCLPG